jgi:hypothetical protein
LFADLGKFEHGVTADRFRCGKAFAFLLTDVLYLQSVEKSIANDEKSSSLTRRRQQGRLLQNSPQEGR